MFDLQDPSSRAVVPMADGALGPTPAPDAALPLAREGSQCRRSAWRAVCMDRGLVTSAACRLSRSKIGAGYPCRPWRRLHSQKRLSARAWERPDCRGRGLACSVGPLGISAAATGLGRAHAKTVSVLLSEPPGVEEAPSRRDGRCRSIAPPAQLQMYPLESDAPDVGAG